MGKDTLVENKLDDGNRLINQLVNDKFDVEGAFWIKTSEDGVWQLYISSPAADAPNLGDALHRVFGALEKIPHCRVAPSDIRLVDINNPIARAAAEVPDWHRAKSPENYSGMLLGNVIVYGAYFYDLRYLRVNAVTDVDLRNGGLWVCKVPISMLKQGPPPKLAEWVSDVRVEGDLMTVEKVRIKPGPDGLVAEYFEEAHSPVSKMIGIKTSITEMKAS